MIVCQLLFYLRTKLIYLKEINLERVDGIEPTSSAWKAVVIAVILYPHLTQASGDWSMVATIQLVTLSALTLTHLPAMDYMVWLPSCPVFWLVASDSNRAHSWLTAKCHRLDDSLPIVKV